jgi:hypothetical protein
MRNERSVSNTDIRRSGWSRRLTSAGRRLLPLTSGKLCVEARRRTGLYDFGEPALEPALSVLVESLEREAQLHPLGRLLMRIHLRDLLETRLRLAEHWRGRQQTLDAAPIRRPIFIVGMPRSGSTFLHELLAESPAHRAPRVWEVMFPVGSGREGTADRARRIRQAEFCLWWFRRLAPRADAVYPMRAQTPHECVAIQSYTFLSEEFVSTCRIPAYEAFLRGTDLRPAYEWQRRFLQHLQGEGPERRWVLKSPDHVYGLAQLFAVFPDAAVIQTHRNPVEVLKSSADLTRVLRGLYGPAGEPGEIRAREARVLAEGTERFMEFRDGHPELAERFIDVKYTELVGNPVGTVRRLCRQLDSPLSEETVRRLEEVAARRSRYRGWRASAEAGAWKPGTGLETRRFKRYCARFELSWQEASLE